ncbi:MAG TPA: hypothetical protein RMH99_00990 [Sandaracinaceae bacterium LLY-WYZ-13_1]|nr:hypothetical protein [Sandaracinaceae bacterium LLY-WYZ-13_1]
MLGRSVRRVRETRFSLRAGERFALFTDGISRAVDVDAHRALGAPTEVARAILQEHGKAHDDASCAVLVL